jgi:hypothetical protein
MQVDEGISIMERLKLKSYYNITGIDNMVI